MTIQIIAIIGGLLYSAIAGIIALFLVSDNKPLLVSIIAGLLWGPIVIYGIATSSFFKP